MRVVGIDSWGFGGSGLPDDRKTEGDRADPGTLTHQGFNSAENANEWRKNGVDL